MISTASFGQEWLWTKIAGGPEIDRIAGIATDHSGNIFVTGYFDSTIVFDTTQLVSSGGTDVFVAKFDPEGVLLWARQVGGQNDDYVSAISTDITGNCYITGFFFIQGATTSFGSTSVTKAGDADLFISKFSSTGNFLWVRNGGGRDEDASFGITTDISGNSYICGYFSGTALFGNNKITSQGYTDVFISKYDAAGNLVWVKTCGGAYQDEAYGICTDIEGNCYVTGYFTGNAMFGNVTLSSAGYFDSDAFLLKFTPSGNISWTKRLGGTGNDFGYGVTVASNGSIFVAGVYKGTKVFGSNTFSTVSGSNGFLAKFDNGGKPQWSKSSTGNGKTEYRKIAADGAGNCFVAASLYGDFQIGNVTNKTENGEACVVKYDGKGNVLWLMQGGGTENDEAIAITADQTGNCYVGGVFTSNAKFGKAKFTGWAYQDIFFSKIK